MSSRIAIDIAIRIPEDSVESAQTVPSSELISCRGHPGHHNG